MRLKVDELQLAHEFQIKRQEEKEETKRSRRRIWLDAQTRKFGSFAELNAWLAERCRALWEEIRHPEYKQFSVAEMLEQERGELMPMPTAFDGYVERSAKVSSTCLVAVVTCPVNFGPIEA